MRGSFTNNLYGAIENEVKSVLQGEANRASDALNVSQGNLDSAIHTLNNANSELERGRSEVQRAQSDVDDAVRELTNLRNRLDSICSTRSCGSGKCTYWSNNIMI